MTGPRISRWSSVGAVRCALWAFAFAMSAMVVHAGDLQTANQFYDQGKFSEAKQHYEQLAQTGESSANVFYNLGNTNYRLGAPGPRTRA